MAPLKTPQIMPPPLTLSLSLSMPSWSQQLLPLPPNLLQNYGNAVYYADMVFIETSAFTKLLPDYLSDEEYRALQTYLMQKPDAGRIVKGSGGVRKIRWAPGGQGKSGGVRVIYYWKKPDHEVWMLTIYSKSERATIPGHILKQIAEAIDHE